jgi:hypothetical protein
MIDLLLDTTTHDLYYANYDLATVEGIDYVRQKLKIRLQFFYGEWFLDNTEGVKLFDNVFVKNPNLRLVASLFKTVILETRGVLSLIEYTQVFDKALRKLTITFRVNTRYGVLATTEAING